MGVQAIVTCEHAGNVVPPRYAGLFRPYENLLRSHRGHDPGALSLAVTVAEILGVPLEYADWTRLLIETNRSEDAPDLFSAVSQILPEPEKDYLRRCRAAYRSRVEQAVRRAIDNGDTLFHVSVHAFTPDPIDDRDRGIDVSFMWELPGSQELGERWADYLGVSSSHNNPYSGDSDCIIRDLGYMFPAGYVGVCVEANQGNVTNGVFPQTLRREIAGGLETALNRMT